MITAAHLRAARAVLDFSQKEVASGSGVSLATIKRLEIDELVVRRIRRR